MKEPVWIGRSVVVAIHDEQIAEHGGQGGIRDEGLLESALARPQNRVAYGTPDLAELAAAYAFGIAKNHPFVDGNKRVAAAVMELFLDQNCQVLTAEDPALVTAILAVADGSMDESALAKWLRANMRSDRP